MSERFIRVAGRADLSPGQMMQVQAEGRRLLLANVEGNFYAVDDLCTHEDIPLYLGCLQGEFIKCSLHGSRFNLRTGEVMDEPADEGLRTYPLRIEGDDILLGLVD